ncbi:MAG: hypothetical protein ACK6DA_15045 [Candidatus Kapaibacterium sp.]|jgi:hypothetical protein
MINTVYIDNKGTGIDIACTDNTLEFANNIRKKYRLIRNGPVISFKNTLYIFYFTEEMMEKARENGTIYEKHA